MFYCESSDFAAGVELVVFALGSEEFLVGAALDDAATFQDDDAVAVADGRETVGDDKGRAAFHQRVHAALHEGLGAGVDAAGCLVEDEHGWVGDRGTCDGKQLALALAQVTAVGIQHGLVAVTQAAYKAVGIDQFGSFDTLLVGCRESAVADVVHHSACEQVGLLQNHAQAVA